MNWLRGVAYGVLRPSGALVSKGGQRLQGTARAPPPRPNPEYKKEAKQATDRGPPMFHEFRLGPLEWLMSAHPIIGVFGFSPSLGVFGFSPSPIGALGNQNLHAPRPVRRANESPPPPKRLYGSGSRRFVFNRPAANFTRDRSTRESTHECARYLSLHVFLPLAISYEHSFFARVFRAYRTFAKRLRNMQPP